MDRRLIRSLAVVGGLAALSTVAMRQHAATPALQGAAKGEDAASELTLRIAAKKQRFLPGEKPGITISLENHGRTAATLIQPGDGNHYGWRTPIIGWSVINADDPKAKHPEDPSVQRHGSVWQHK